MFLSWFLTSWERTMSKVEWSTKPLQTEVKMSTKPLLKFYCALLTGKESAENNYSTWLLWKSLLCGLFMKTFVFLPECLLDALLSLVKTEGLADSVNKWHTPAHTNVMIFFWLERFSDRTRSFCASFCYFPALKKSKHESNIDKESSSSQKIPNEVFHSYNSVIFFDQD